MSWSAFQSDVLDTLRQYRGYMDFFEQIGSVERSRPDCFCRISRENKKEIWIVDAKNKGSIGEDDLGRMRNYVEKVRSNPVDVGLELRELSEHEIRPIFVPNSSAELEEFETVPFSRLHQFLQRELLYSETDKVVRDVAKMVKNRELNHNQARMLHRSLKPYLDVLNNSMRTLRDMEENYIGLEVKEPPLSSFDFKIPVDAVLKHEKREKTFLIDIPYSRKSLENLENRVHELRDLLSGQSDEIYYAALNGFQQVDRDHVYRRGEIEDQIRSTAGVLSPEEVMDMFSPRLSYDDFRDGDTLNRKGEGFQISVRTKDDVNYRVEAELSSESASKVSETISNSIQDFGNLNGERFRIEFLVTEEMEIELGSRRVSLSNFKESARNLFRSPITSSLRKNSTSSI